MGLGQGTAVIIDTFWQSNSITLAVEKSSQLSYITKSLHIILYTGSLHEVCVHAVLLPYSVQALGIGLGVDTGLC